MSTLQTQASAIRMLQSRIETIKHYLVQVSEGLFRRIVLDIWRLIWGRKSTTGRTYVEGNLLLTLSTTSCLVHWIRKRIRKIMGRCSPHKSLHRNPQGNRRYPRGTPHTRPRPSSSFIGLTGLGESKGWVGDGLETEEIWYVDGENAYERTRWSVCWQRSIWFSLFDLWWLGK